MPQSRGAVTLASGDPSVPPLIDPNYLAHPFDREVAVAAERRLFRNVLTTPRIAKHVKEPLVRLVVTPRKTSWLGGARMASAPGIRRVLSRWEVGMTQ